MQKEISLVENYRSLLEDGLNKLINDVGKLKIGRQGQFPYGWRKAAKGRTIWRLLEELITQNLQKNSRNYNMQDMAPSESEVSVFDFTCNLSGYTEKIFVNVKGASIENRNSKDDISKATKLVEFYREDHNRKLFVATFNIRFESELDETLLATLDKCYVMPIAWIPDIYVNPSNNANLQSSKYKDITSAIKRTNKKFLDVFAIAHKVALDKRSKKIKK